MSKRKAFEELSVSQAYRRAKDVQGLLEQMQESSTDEGEDENQDNIDMNIEENCGHAPNENENFEPDSAPSEDNSADADGGDMNEVPHQPLGSSSSSNESLSEASNATESSDEEEDITISLKRWMIESRTSRSDSNKLLCILRRVPVLHHLPLTRNTFIATPRGLIELKNVEPGKYFHFGFQEGLKIAIDETSSDPYDEFEISVMINIDGISLFKSSPIQFVPILGRATNLPGSNVFKIGVYEGGGKPVNVHEFLEDFVTESQNLITHGFLYKNMHFKVIIKGFVMDLPAKAFVLNTIYHTGENSCTKCVVQGTRIERRTTFFDLNCDLRTDESFRLQDDPDHHHGVTPLINIPKFDMVKNVVIDPFHQLFEGATKKKVKLLYQPSPQRLPRNIRRSLSEEMLRMRRFIPWEFCRKPRTFDYLDRFKCTEFRLLLLYIGVVVFQKLLNGDPTNDDHYKHFLTLHVAARMLSSNPSDNEIDYCNRLLRNFVTDFKTLHGEVSITQNIHSLIHLAADVRTFGSLQNFDAFPFENENGKLNRDIKCGPQPLKQLVRRYQEKVLNIPTRRSKAPKKTTSFSGIRQQNIGPIIEGCMPPCFEIASFDTFKIGVNEPNNCILTKDKQIFIVENIAFCNVRRRNVLIGREYQQKVDLYTEPRHSSNLDIYKASDLGILQLIDPKNVLKKCFRVPILEDCDAILPLLHN